MSLVELAIPTEDVSFASLGLLLGGPAPRSPLARLDLPSPDAHRHLTLEIIGASHVATIRAEGRPAWREELSCHASHGGGHPLGPGLSAGETITRAEGGYRLRAWAQRFPDRAALDSWAGQLKRELEAQERPGGRRCLIAEFPGEGNNHLTAVQGWWDSHTAHWATWHVYPGELVAVVSASTHGTPAGAAVGASGGEVETNKHTNTEEAQPG